jgi:RHS repeat-associated protein
VDALGRQTALIDASGYRTEYRYDENGNLTCVIDANAQASLRPKNSLGCSEYRQYDELNRPTRVVDALNGETRFSYDLLGNRLTVTDAQNQTWRFGYDDLGRLTAQTDHSGKAIGYQPDEAGNVYQKVNRLGEVTRYSFDRGNRLTRVDYLLDASAETFGYDAAGNLSTTANAAVGYALAYDRLNRLTSKLDSRGRSLAFTYDKAGNLLTKTTYQGSTTAYLYNAANQLVQLSNPDYLQVDYQYDPAGRLLSRVMSSGARTLYQYQANGALSRLAHYDGADGLIADTTYTRDRLGHITQATDVSGSTLYAYDALYRLKTADFPGTASDEAFDYDPVGNRKLYSKGSLVPNANTRYYTYLAGSNRLAEIRIGAATGAVESSFGYNAEGQLTSQAGVGARTLTWDAKGRVATLTSAGRTESYLHDPLDQRIGRAGGSLGSLGYFLEGEHLESIYSGVNLQAKYLRGASIDELVAGYLYDTDGKLKPYLFHHDHLTSTAAVSGHNGGTLQSIQYGAFGAVRANSGSSPNRLKYTGREDDGTGLYYYRARYYDPGIGRFISEDPLGFEAGEVNFYAYVGNDPVNANDPSGHIGEAKIFQLLAKGVELIGGKLPRNAKLAGDVHPKTGVPFKCTGCPDFSGVAVKEVKIKQTGNNVVDFVAADKAAGLTQRPPGYTWHHVEDGTTMQLVPTTVHSATGHTGGAAIARTGATAAGVAASTNVQAADPAGILGTGITWRDVGEFVFDILFSPGAANAPTMLVPPSPSNGSGAGLGSGARGSAAPAGGGFVLYPNKSNLNMTQSVYSK